MKIKKNKYPAFTVILPLYFNDKYLFVKKAIFSIYSNDLTPEKVLLIVDGPLPRNLNFLIKKLQKDFGYRIIRLANNVGLANALNFGLKFVKTEWVIRADADDYNVDFRFRKLMDLIKKNPKLDLVGSGISEFDQNNIFLANRVPPLTGADIIKYIKFRCPFNHMSVAFRLSKVLECGGYPSIPYREDYALWALLIKNKANVQNISDILVLAQTGDAMFKRRSGFMMLRSEFLLHKLLLECKLRKPISGLFIFIIRALIFQLHPFFLKKIYLFFLRESL